MGQLLADDLFLKHLVLCHQLPILFEGEAHFGPDALNVNLKALLAFLELRDLLFLTLNKHHQLLLIVDLAIWIVLVILDVSLRQIVARLVTAAAQWSQRHLLKTRSIAKLLHASVVGLLTVLVRQGIGVIKGQILLRLAFVVPADRLFETGCIHAICARLAVFRRERVQGRPALQLVRIAVVQTVVPVLPRVLLAAILVLPGNVYLLVQILFEESFGFLRIELVESNIVVLFGPVQGIGKAGALVVPSLDSRQNWQRSAVTPILKRVIAKLCVLNILGGLLLAQMYGLTNSRPRLREPAELLIEKVVALLPGVVQAVWRWPLHAGGQSGEHFLTVNWLFGLIENRIFGPFAQVHLLDVDVLWIEAIQIYNIDVLLLN